MRAPGLLLVCVALSACASQAGEPEKAGGIPRVWDIEFFDRDQEDLGSIRLALTDEPIDEDYCGDAYQRKAVIIDDQLTVDLDLEKRPAYSISFYWLRLDLTASVCHTNFLLLGNIDASEASGFFNYAHPLGGQNIGRFHAVPVREAD
jgi:hypothetical protein